MEKNQDLLLDVKNLKVSFKIKRNKYINIVRGVDLKIGKGQIVGIVGESGSGKSVTSKSFLNINENSLITADRMQIEDIDLLKSKKESFW
ncbi:ABC-type dipeptide/oligopeptide/nickel transport system ATP-binding protein (DppD/OppD), partial [Mycoplasmopsis edwardii]